MHNGGRVLEVWLVCGWFEDVGFCPFDVAGPAGAFFGGGYGVPLGFAGAAVDRMTRLDLDGERVVVTEKLVPE